MLLFTDFLFYLGAGTFLWLLFRLLLWSPPSVTPPVVKEHKRSSWADDEDKVIHEHDVVDGNEAGETEEDEEEVISLGAALDRLLPARFRRRYYLTVFQRAVPVLAVVLLAIWMAWPSKITMEDDGRPGSEPKSLLSEVLTLSGSGIHYYHVRGWINEQKQRVPVIACEHFPGLDILHAKLLHQVDLVPSSPAVTPQKGKKKKSVALTATPTTPAVPFDPLREQTRHQCVLDPKRITVVDEHGKNHEGHLARPALGKVSAPPDWNQTAGVDKIFVTADGRRYYRVMMILPTTAATGNKNYKLQPTLVAESDLRNAAAYYYSAMKERALEDGFSEDRPCLCLEHFGIMGSGLFYFYDEAANEWHLRIQSGVARNDISELGPPSQPRYNKNLEFPHHVDKLYPVGEQRHQRTVVVRSLDPQLLFQTDAGRAEIALDWVPYPALPEYCRTPVVARRETEEEEEGEEEEEEEEHSMPPECSREGRENGYAIPKFNILAVVNLTRILLSPTPSSAIVDEMVSGFQNVCFHHCLAIMTKVAEL